MVYLDSFTPFIALSFPRSMRAKARSLGYSLSHKALQRVTRGKQGKCRVVREQFHFNSFHFSFFIFIFLFFLSFISFFILEATPNCL